jgi:hypothetical protein
MNERRYDWRVYPVLDVTRPVEQLMTGLMMHVMGVALISVVAFARMAQYFCLVGLHNLVGGAGVGVCLLRLLSR